MNRSDSPKRKKEWFDKSEFWEELYPFMFPAKRLAETPDEIEKVLSLSNPPGKNALDLCCGPGRCAVALAHNGFKVTGVDKTSYLLKKARAKARSEKLKIEFLQMDMRDFVRSNSYDLVLSMFTSFGYFDDKDEDIGVLENILECLHPKGIFFIDVMGKECLAKVFQGSFSEVLPNGTRLVQCNQVFDDWSRVRNEWILIRKGRAKSFKFHHTIYSGQELKDRMVQVGFEDVRLFGNLEGDEYGPRARRLIAIGRKGK